MKLCCVFNYNPLYRLPIYKAMDDFFHPDFYFGDTVFQPLKQFDPAELHGFKKYVNAKKCLGGKIINYSNTQGVFNRKYTHYIITGSNSSILNWKILLYGKLTGRKVYIWCHGEHDYIIKKRVRLFQRTFYRLAKGLLVYQEYAEPYMRDLGVDISKIRYIHNSLDTQVQTDIYNNIRPSLIFKDHFKNNAPTIIYIGRIQLVKRIDQLIEAVEHLKHEGKDVNLVIVGQNVDYTDFDRIIQNSIAKDSIWVYGPCFDETKNAELIYNSHLLVSPGNVGLSCIHSLSYGTPVVTNDNLCTQMPEHGAIIEGVTGSFFKENDIIDLANKIWKWASITEKERESIRAKARESIIKSWSIDYQLNLLKTLLK